MNKLCINLSNLGTVLFNYVSFSGLPDEALAHADARQLGSNSVSEAATRNGFFSIPFSETTSLPMGESLQSWDFCEIYRISSRGEKNVAGQVMNIKPSQLNGLYFKYSTRFVEIMEDLW